MELFEDPNCSAIFSPCRRYRYELFRQWDPNPPKVAFIGLNPSTADETNDDPTIRRCIGFARRWGYGGLYMLNIFAFRATNPRDMKQQRDPIGPDNDQHLIGIAPRVEKIICAWGAHGSYKDRGKQVVDMLRGQGAPLYYLGETMEAHPLHPLYLSNDKKPILYD